MLRGIGATEGWREI